MEQEDCTELVKDLGAAGREEWEEMGKPWGAHISRRD